MKPYNVILTQWNTSQVPNMLAASVNRIILGTPSVGLFDLPRHAENWIKEWKAAPGAVANKERIYILANNMLYHEVMSLFHDNL